MHRDIAQSGADWRISGIGYDDVTVSPTSNGAKLTNTDGLNGTPQGWFFASTPRRILAECPR